MVLPIKNTLSVYFFRHDEYGDTIHEEEKCVIMDFTDPDHCSNGHGCEVDLMSFGHRVRRDLDLEVIFEGWFDPQPDSVVASGSGKSNIYIYFLFLPFDQHCLYP